MGMKISLDTNIFISVINEESGFEICKKILHLIETREIEGHVSTIVISEILVGYYRNKDNDKVKRFSSYVKNLFQIVKVDLNIASEAARLRVQGKMKLPDALVIASSKNSDYLITLDEKLINYNSQRILSPDNFWKKIKK